MVVEFWRNLLDNKKKISFFQLIMRVCMSVTNKYKISSLAGEGTAGWLSWQSETQRQVHLFISQRLDMTHSH